MKWMFISLIFFIIILFLLIYIIIFKKELIHILKEIEEIQNTDTNRLINISLRDKTLINLSSKLNIYLKEIRKEKLKLENGDREIKEAITNISHDLRTPLTSISGYLDLLESQNQSEKSKSYIEIIKNSCKSMKSMTEELFKYSFISAKLDDMKIEKICINNILEESIISMYASLQKNNINPLIDISNVKSWAKLDKKNLKRIFENIIINAIKYSKGDLNIKLDDKGKIIFSNKVSDFDYVAAEKLFDRFYTVKTSTKSTGIGLSIAKLLTDQMGGKIYATYKNDTLSIILNFEDILC